MIEYANLREFINSNVKKVIWVYFEGNDLTDLNAEKGNKTLMNYLNDLSYTQDLKSKQNEIDDLAIKKIEKEILKFIFTKLKNFLTIFETRTLIYKIPPPPPPPAPGPKFKKILKLANDLAIKNNSKLYFVYLPEYARYKKNYDNTNFNLVKNIVTELNIPFIDIHKKSLKRKKIHLNFFHLNYLFIIMLKVIKESVKLYII